MNSLSLDRALRALGDLLATAGEEVRLVTVGGAALRLQGFVDRTTQDVDIIGRVPAPGADLAHPEPLPRTVVRAVATVARDLGLPAGWLNTEIAAQWLTGLPPGLIDDITWRRFGGPPGGLVLGLVGRKTLITLERFAAVDRGPGSVHFQDLLALAPSSAELHAAAEWVLTQDVNPVFAEMVGQVVDRVSAANA